jgi:Flp pilus assembly protein TadG
VEFALIVGVLVLLLFGMLQFGVAFFEIQNLRAASREGARLGAVGANEATIRARVEEASLGSIPAASGAMSVVVCPSPSGVDDTSTVAIDLGSGALPGRLQDIFELDIPLMPPITLSPTVSGEFRCER